MTILRDEVGRLLLPFLDDSMTFAQSCQLADQMIRLVRDSDAAQAGEAGMAETVKLGSVHEHAVHEVDAPHG